MHITMVKIPKPNEAMPFLLILAGTIYTILTFPPPEKNNYREVSFS